ncbi:GNAT family N-acetyltransferase [Halobacillus halophilus]|uniref:Acetyltransferase, GNAT family n=1 Tax=Halobacillus halophilus (strain ATCC 35676 / DSM 2266 / JCM 20832 / KCTC 3685 / LMG 17431 / NBRC 102448 / NCIMB 2269) TaxID=866895 RepID=I0JSW0_HALH3|nr:GNAT family N-acetyltransferase [Halobacillus halophilus]ASF41153.1 GNAT family N-acetyltransferase [Halobacillus halophilus]CCG47232.1 acetyltransferase, GNAT family [Halobacillus halophilus DSM 2266]
MNSVILEEVQNRNDYMPYLLLADESEDIINGYINEGELYVMQFDNKEVGVVLFTFPSLDTVEIKNIAITEKARGHGIGKQAIQQAVQIFSKRHYARLIVGTANSSLGNLAFYQKAGFRFFEIRRDFFLHYPSPVFENGIQALDMVVFERTLQI